MVIQHQCAIEFWQIRAQLASAGSLIRPDDLQIAAIALMHNLMLVTHNIRELAKIKALEIEDWEVEV